MANNTFPSDWEEQPCFLVSIPRPLVPYVGGLLKILETRGFWVSEEAYERGLKATMQLEECLMSTCLDVLMEKQDALYRLVNTVMLGQTYSIVSPDPLVVSPTIEPFVSLEILDQDSLMGRIERLTQLVDNRLAGTETPLYDELPGIKQQLEAIITALGEGTDLTEVISNLEAIALLLA